jgi:hypothetical protein
MHASKNEAEIKIKFVRIVRAASSGTSFEYLIDKP